MKAGPQDARNIAAAIAEYSKWDPDNGRYAVGYHSVTSEFSDFTANPTSHYHTLGDLGQLES